MKLELDLDIETILAEAVKEAISPERIQNQINTHVNNAVENALDKALNRWSPFSKALEEQVKEAMPIGDYQVPRYHDYIIKAVQESIAESQQEMAQRMVNERIKDLVGGEFPKEMSLSEMLWPQIIHLLDLNCQKQAPFFVRCFLNHLNLHQLKILAQLVTVLQMTQQLLTPL